MFRVHLTGFGPFPGVEVNPTESLLRGVRHVVQSNPDDDVLASVASFSTFECSVAGASAHLRALQASSQSERRYRHCFVHFGVNTTISTFNIETRGVNCADFRCPDVRGVVLRRKKIVDDLHIDEAISSDVPFEKILKDLCETYECVSLSKNAGRYLCNYVYFKSLSFCKDKPGVTCIFVHIPPFASIDLNTQVIFVVDFLRTLHNRLKDSSREILGSIQDNKDHDVDNMQSVIHSEE